MAKYIAYYGFLVFISYYSFNIIIIVQYFLLKKSRKFDTHKFFLNLSSVSTIPTQQSNNAVSLIANKYIDI